MPPKMSLNTPPKMSLYNKQFARIIYFRTVYITLTDLSYRMLLLGIRIKLKVI